MSKRYYWLKLHKDFFKSKEIKKLRKIAGGDTFVIIYLKMSLLSLENNGVIEYEGIEKTLAEELSLELDEDPVNVNATILFLQNMGMMEERKEDEFSIPLVENNTGSETPQASSMRKKRSIENQQDTSKDVTLLQDCYKSVTLEKENREKRKEKDNNYIGISEAAKCQGIFDAWNRRGVVKHRVMTSGIKAKILKRLREYSNEDLLDAIRNYADVYFSTDTYFTHKWTIEEFMSRDKGMPVFLHKGVKDYLVRTSNTTAQRSNVTFLPRPAND